ncbi:anti-sigma factor domain-containing protein [Arthrobacter sp. MDT2-2]
MQHLDPDAVGLAALGEPLDLRSQEHLVQCSICSAEVDALRRVVFTAKGEGPLTVLERPGPAVWDAIKTELGLPAELGVDGAASAPEPSGNVRSLAAARDEGGGRRRQFSARWLAVAAGVGILVGAGALWGLESLRAGETGVVLAQAELDPLPGFSGSGKATVSRADDGTRRLDVDLAGATPEGYRQVWLIAPDLLEMYSVGLMDADQASFAVPADIDLARYPIVDISDEPLDGNPAHSSISMVRGTIQAVGT